MKLNQEQADLLLKKMQETIANLDEGAVILIATKDEAFISTNKIEDNTDVIFSTAVFTLANTMLGDVNGIEEFN